MKEKKGSGFARFLIAFIIAIIVFGALLVIQSNVTNKYKKSSVLVVKEGGVPARTDITKDNYKDYFEVVERATNQLPEGSIEEKDIESIYGVTIKNDLVKGEILNQVNYVNTEDFISYIGEDKVKAGFGISELSNVICGTLRRGDVIDITVIYYKDNDDTTDPLATTLSNVVVENVYDDSGVAVTDETGTTATMFTLILTPEQNKILDEMLIKGTSIIRISKSTDITYGKVNGEATVTTKVLNANEVSEEMNATSETEVTSEVTEEVPTETTETVTEEKPVE